MKDKKYRVTIYADIYVPDDYNTTRDQLDESAWKNAKAAKESIIGQNCVGYAYIGKLVPYETIGYNLSDKNNL